MPTYSEVLNIRAEAELKARLIRLSKQPKHRGRDIASLARIALEDYCTAEEEAMGLDPITSDETNEMLSLLMAERSKATPSPLAPSPPPPSANAAPVNYRKKGTRDTAHKPRQFPKG